MSKRLQDYVKYTTKELESYVERDGSCVYKIKTGMHFALAPYVLADFKQALRAHIMRRKVGRFDMKLNGIILDVKNIKVLSPTGALRADDVRIHIDIIADCYVFRPVAGALLSGQVKHIGIDYFGVIIYRVFNASIRLKSKPQHYAVELEQELQIYINDFNIQTVFPYLQGELLAAPMAPPTKVNGHEVLNAAKAEKATKNTHVKAEPKSDSDTEHTVKSTRNKRKLVPDADESVTVIRTRIKIEPVDTGLGFKDKKERKNCRVKIKPHKAENIT